MPPRPDELDALLVPPAPPAPELDALLVPEPLVLELDALEALLLLPPVPPEPWAEPVSSPPQDAQLATPAERAITASGIFHELVLCIASSPIGAVRRAVCQASVFSAHGGHGAASGQPARPWSYFQAISPDASCGGSSARLSGAVHFPELSAETLTP
jgi:hypothetical protein